MIRPSFYIVLIIIINSIIISLHHFTVFSLSEEFLSYPHHHEKRKHDFSLDDGNGATGRISASSGSTRSSGSHSSKRSSERRLLEGNENDSFPHGHKKSGRIAIILTGQLRSANMSWTSGLLHPSSLLLDHHHSAADQHSSSSSLIFGPADPPNPAMTIVERIFKPLARKYPLDVFMFQTAHPGASNIHWDGQPENYQTVESDTRGCELFSNNKVFQHTGNRFFCLIEPEEPLMNHFIANYSLWYNFNTNGASSNQQKEQVLQQLYAMYRGNLAAKQYALASGMKYSYKIRLRPDMAVVHPFPDLSAFDFDATSPGTNATIYYANRAIHNNGNEGGFNIGRADDMDHLLDRYVDFISLSHLISTSKPFSLEQNLLGIMQVRYKIAMVHHKDISMVIIRVANHHTTTSSSMPPKQSDWEEMSTP